jgi:hypothetical protein
MAKKNDGLSSFLNPTAKGFNAYIRSQQQAFNPLISMFTNQYGALGKKGSKEKVIEALLGATASDEAVRQGYARAGENMRSALQGINLGQASQDVGAMIGAVGAGIGASAGATADTASAVAANSGDIMREAILGGSLARLKQTEVAELQGLNERRSNLSLAGAEAAEGRQDKRMEIARMLGDVRSKKLASTPNPLELANSVLGYKSNMLDYKKALKDFNSSKRSNKTTTPDPDETPDPWDEFGEKYGLTEADAKRYWQMNTGAKR